MRTNYRRVLAAVVAVLALTMGTVAPATSAEARTNYVARVNGV